ncbi:MAG: VCBS repeat-containing protein [Candidatus Riflebacteria bacterium]|nr:VCBS repeat-containing protein [Candidatus Riflebacteria bacterium]
MSLDLDRNGQPDIAAVNNWSDTVSVLYGNGLGDFPTVRSFTPGLTQPRSLAVADIDRNGLPDLVVGASWEFSVLLGR